MPRARHHEYVDALAAEMSGLRVGDPSDTETRLGPLVSCRQQQRVRDCYLESKSIAVAPGG